jgi:hypothetical protein
MDPRLRHARGICIRYWKIYVMIHFRHSGVTVEGNRTAMLLDRILLLIALALAAATLALLVVAS